MSGDGTSFAAATDIRSVGNNVFSVSHGTDRNLIVEFYTDAEYQEFASTQSGSAIYKDVDMIRIKTPGMNGNTIERKVKLVDDQASPADPNRFPNQWRAFKLQQEQRPDGTPIEQWAALKKSHVLTLKAQGVFVIEQIAALPDTSLGILGLEGRRLREMAKSYLDKDAQQAALSMALSDREKFRADLEALREQVSAMRGTDVAQQAQEMATMRQQIVTLQTEGAALKSENEALKAAAASIPTKPKRGRPSTKSKETT
jgi:hypothetical protein